MPLPFFTAIFTPESEEEELEFLEPLSPEPLPAEDITVPIAESTTVSSVGESPCFTRLIIFCHSWVFAFSYQISFSYTEVVGDLSRIYVVVNVDAHHGLR